MKCLILLVLGCLVLDALGTPIQTNTKLEKRSEAVATSKVETARQSDTQNQVNTDDEDSDEDDDEEDLGLDDDDDDDDDEEGETAASDEEDDDDGDYIERFFDDILGDEDDDDDDEDEDSSATVVQPSAVVAPQAAQPVAAPEAVAEAQASEQSAGEIPNYDDENPGDETNVVATIDNEAEKDPQVVVTAAPATAAPPAAPPAQPITAAESEEEDDDDDDDDDLGIDEDDDDDDDDEEEEDDDDDDDDDDIEDLVDARSAHHPKARAMDSAQSPRVPPSFITKYNRYVDNIMERINKILRTGYDPVNVRLHSVKSNKNPTKKKTAAKNNKNNNKKKGNKKSNKKKNKNSNKNNNNENKKGKRSRKQLRLMEEGREVNITISNVTVVEEAAPSTTLATPTNLTNATVPPTVVSRAQPTKKKTAVKTKATSTNSNSKPRAKATLYGMASLKRSDDVNINLMSTHTTIKSRFTIGPLTLKVEKEFGRGAKKELRSATATTTEMVGKINLRVKHGGSATLHSIRVMQPNLLRVDTPDDHDKTREFVWKRSFHIAQIVSQKLTKAARSLLEPPPQPPKKKQKKKPADDGGILSYFL